jgi:mannose-1-phosphate guanylyltransferase/phosphomannomutase
VPYDAPAALDGLARGYGARVLRLGRDREADTLWVGRPRLRDGVFMGARLCAYLAERGERLAGLRRYLPRFALVTREVSLNGDRGAVMRMLLRGSAGTPRETSSGLRLETELGFVTISPLRDRSALRIRTESFNEETAEELCAEFERRARQADQA